MGSKFDEDTECYYLDSLECVHLISEEGLKEALEDSVPGDEVSARPVDYETCSNCLQAFQLESLMRIEDRLGTRTSREKLEDTLPGVNSKQVTIFALALGMMFLASVLGSLVPVLKFASSLTMAQAFLGLFFEYLNTKYKITLVFLQVLQAWDSIQLAWAFSFLMQDSMALRFTWFAPGPMEALLPGLMVVCIFLIQPFVWHRTYKGIGLYERINPHLGGLVNAE